MARVSPVNSNGENVDEQPSSQRGTLKKVDEVMDVASGGSSKGDEEESEYEIEAILDAKRGSFPDGRMGFYVKWKGYGEEENSWVDEKDAGNAEALIAEFWKKQNKKKASRKSTDAKTPKRARMSSAPEDNSDMESASAPKKRGRKSKADSDLENGRGEQENDGSRIRKKTRKSAAAKAQKATAQEEGEVEIGDMSNHMHVPDWETLITSVDTVERDDEGTLWVYFTLHNGEHVKEKSILCAERFPQKLIKFYEMNLRWRSSEEL